MNHRDQQRRLAEQVLGDIQPINRIALIGTFGVGKTSIAEAWCKLTEGHKLSFADTLKDEVAAALAGIAIMRNDEQSYDFWSVKQRIDRELRDPATKDQYRLIQQVWGTEFRRAQNDNYWVDQLLDYLPISTEHVAVDDCRFNNEYEALRAQGFRFVLLEAGPTHRDQGKLNNHASELQWPTWPVDYNLTYMAGPDVQAKRLIEAGFGTIA